MLGLVRVRGVLVMMLVRAMSVQLNRRARLEVEDKDAAVVTIVTAARS